MSEGQTTIRPTSDGGLLIYVPMCFRKRAGRKRIIAPNGLDGVDQSDQSEEQERLPAILARAHAWSHLIDEGRYASTKELAMALGKDFSYINRILRLTTLAPDITQAILNGREPNGLSLKKLREVTAHDWEEQRRMLGFK